MTDYGLQLVNKSSIETVEDELLQFPQVSCPVTHKFSPGLYIREVFMPAGTFAIGHSQNTTHYNVMLSGSVVMLNDDGSTTKLVAPCSFVAGSGRKIGIVTEDMIWQNIYPTTETDIDTLENIYITKSESWQYNDKLRKNMLILEREFDRLDYLAMLDDVGITHSQALVMVENEEDRIDINISGIRIDDSAIQGKGIFATIPFSSGATISPSRLDGKRTQAGRFTNHSANPNACMKKINDDIYLVAISDIKGCEGGFNGEEITVDYRQAINETNKEVLCQQ